MTRGSAPLAQPVEIPAFRDSYLFVLLMLLLSFRERPRREQEQDKEQDKACLSGWLTKGGAGRVLRIAQHFSAGVEAIRRTKSRQGRQNASSVPAGTFFLSRHAVPSAEALGYCQKFPSANPPTTSPALALSTNRIGMERPAPPPAVDNLTGSAYRKRRAPLA